MAARQSGAQLVVEHMENLVQRVTLVDPIADALLSSSLISYESYSNIRCARTSQEKMREVYTALHPAGESGKIKFFHILKEKEPFLIQELENQKRAERVLGEDPKVLTEKYKRLVKCEVSALPEYNSLLGEDVSLEERYTNVVLIRRHRKEMERQEELKSRGPELQKIISARDDEDFPSTNLQNLFDPDPLGFVMKTVVLQGPAGIGKSFTTLKMMSEWASGRLYSELFDYVFLLKCQQLNLINSDVSLVDLILSCCQDLQPAIPHILSQPEKVLFLIDGFDELKLSLKPENFLPIDPDQKTSLDLVLSHLLGNTLFPHSFLLITTRSMAVDKLKPLLTNPVYTEILGFSEDRMEEYVNKFFKDENHAALALKYVREHEHVYTMCFVPVMCWIVCTVLREHFDEGTDIQHILQTNTSIFVYFVCILLKHHSKGSSLSQQNILKCLSDLASSGLRKRQVLLEEDAIISTFPDLGQVPSSFLNKILLKKFVSCQTVFSFIHLTFQEFFAALLYILCEEEEANSSVKELLESVQIVDILLGGSYFFSIAPFLFGLLNPRTQDYLRKEVGVHTSSGIKHLLLAWITQQECCESNEFNRQLVFHCLYEIDEDHFVRRVMRNFTAIKPTFKRRDILVASYCLGKCEHIKYLSLSGCDFRPKELEKLLPVLCKCEELVLDSRRLEDEGVTILKSALNSSNSRIHKLSLLESGLRDTALDNLCSGVRDMAKLTSFSMGVRNLSEEKLTDLLAALSTQQALSTVELVLDNITKKTASSLVSMVVKCSNLEELRLRCDDPSGRDMEDYILDSDSDLKIVSLRPACQGKNVRFESEESTVLEANLICGEFVDNSFATEICEMQVKSIEGLTSADSLQKVVSTLELLVCCSTEEITSNIISFLKGCQALKHLIIEPRYSYEDDIITIVFDDNVDEHLEKWYPALKLLESLSTVTLRGCDPSKKQDALLSQLALSCQGLKTIVLQSYKDLEPRRVLFAHTIFRGQTEQEKALTVLYYDEFFEAIWKSDLEIVHFGFRFSELTCADIAKLIQNSFYYKTEIIMIAHCELKNETVAQLCSFLQKCSNLRNLRLTEDCLMYEEGLQLLLPVLSALKSLTELELPLYCFKVPQVASIDDLFQTCSKLQVLRVNSDWLTEELITDLYTSFCKSHYRVTISGWICNKESNKCTQKTQRSLSCNTHVIRDTTVSEKEVVPNNLENT